MVPLQLTGSAMTLLAVTWLSWLVLEILLVRGGAIGQRSQDAGSMRWMVLCVVVSFAVGLQLSRQPDGRISGDPDTVIWTGLVVLWVGLGLRLLAILWLGRLFNASVVIQRGHRLVTSGPYRLVRHPSYTGALIAAVGLGVALGHWTSVAAFAVGWLVGLAYRIPVEEAAMRRAFGRQYEEYSARTRRLIPLIF